MTTQSMPISKTKKDYIQSAIVLLVIAGSTAIAVFLSRQGGIIMRQPRMTVVFAVGAIAIISGFIFIDRNPYPFHSRRFSYSMSALCVLALLAIAFFTDEGTNGAWFRFAILVSFIVIGLTALTELMVFYRKLISKKSFKNHIVHKVIFSIVIGLIVSGATFLYYENGVGGGAILDYGTPTPILERDQPILDQPIDPNLLPLETQAPDTPVATDQ